MILKETTINNYATALFNIAVKEKLVDDYIIQVDALIKSLADKDEFNKLVTYSNKEQKKQAILIIENTFSSFGFDIYLINALKILVENQLFINTRMILKVLYKKLLAYKNIVLGEVYSTEKLTKTQLNAIKKKISNKVNKKVELVNKIDPTLIGGIKVSVEDKVFDGSIKAKLEALKKQMNT
ncbi:F0F1 ATP synthase subunit delta [Mycoplasma mycoides subsp. mycoides]|uniref:ATP synthase subunit delta n=2 Tax=Mycoplasma mycoides subsp. mycoides TaxID=2103 RepID=ATPD_MYCMS|nr:F0F1 ATP synthase subunit delta [Mycoplasma mycoides]Q6MS91.1 RecName: Full=ATP synthase subunit delta; AltName: Full=ATP synthase F(1) sector subunit delta; AltName: Full=F-type ATPase subunit delta; Short=F-ATPase subunit delta [Mycoplasma mycoides subsp. mycoides SC str. PG1]ADK69382.1 ATP synthase F1, delta subunit [Mycoplasma mycoides subsp. mycoides SC str. Gladysdale]AIZ55751.1 ATP synthase F0F1 subunit delta [Mycoplasma mycoides subsp. mycoides]AME11063.1 ATP synthase F0F1 subunit de